MNELNPPKGLGFIVRTAGLERSKRELARDLAYLLRLWKVILRRIKKARTPAPIYQESDMITRTIRDIFTSEIDTIWIDEPAAFERAQEFLRVVMPRFVDRLKLYDEKVPLFHKYGIEDEIAKIQRRRVDLREGGSIVIDQTEALVAIDVNSGNFRVENDAERTAYEMNLRAAKEIARQLRLRDLGGVIVNDFIDMREEQHRRGVEKALRDAIKRDRARTKVLRMSAFGLIEMTRQRIRPSLKRSVYEDCPHCAGAGVVKTVESMSIDVMRLLALASHREDIRRVNVSVCPAVASYLNNRKRREHRPDRGRGQHDHPHPRRGGRPRPSTSRSSASTATTWRSASCRRPPPPAVGAATIDRSVRSRTVPGPSLACRGEGPGPRRPEGCPFIRRIVWVTSFPFRGDHRARPGPDESRPGREEPGPTCTRSSRMAAISSGSARGIASPSIAARASPAANSSSPRSCSSPGPTAPTIGTPLVEGARVVARIVNQFRTKKIIIQKFRRRKGMRRRKGHRQPYTTVQITSVATA